MRVATAGGESGLSPERIGSVRAGRPAAFVAQLRRTPVAFAFAFVVLSTALATGAARGLEVQGALGWGRSTLQTPSAWWAAATSLTVPDSAVDAILSIALALTVLPIAERLLGSARTLVSMAVAGVTALVVGAAVQSILTGLPEVSEIATRETVLDPAIAISGAVLAASALASALWRRRIRVVAFAVLGMFALYAGDVDSWFRLIGALCGLGIGMLFARRAPHRPWHRSSTRETRSLIAAIVAVTAAGPIAALISGGGRGPLSMAAMSFAQFDQHLVDRCNADYTRLCDHQAALLVTRGAGPAILAVVPLVLLLLTAWGLRSGRRAAWMLGVVVNAAIAGLAVLSIAFGGVVFVDPDNGAAFEWGLWAVSSIGVPAGVLALLIITRRRFAVAAPRRAVRAMLGIVSAAFVACVLVFFLVESLFPKAFRVRPTAMDLLDEAVRRFVPPAFLQGVGELPYPHMGAGLAVYQWIGVAFWAVVIVAMLHVYRATRHPDDVEPHSATVYRSLLRRGAGTLSFLGTWPGNAHWISADLEASVAYRVVNGVALAVADPLCTSARAARTLREFADFAYGRGWTPVFYSIHEDYLPDLHAMGWHTVSVGEETVMRLGDLELTGSQWQKVRQPLNRAEREGMTAHWTRWQDLSASMAAQIVEISEQWVADRGLPEMGFTIGGVDELNDPDVVLLLAVDAQGRLQAVTSWMPWWERGAVTGWTLDFMRRREDAPNGVMEFLIAKAALLMKARGAAALSLSGAPLAGRPRPVPEGPAEVPTLARFLGWLATAMEPVYGFASLFRFKSKFHPEYRTLYLAYADPVTLPAVGSAVMRAYLPDASPREYLAAMRSIFAGAAGAQAEGRRR
ncbi:bifunctional lysylphosphatidylglycerol flippase/synthetase MprF [Microbacterium sp. B2969]|uniref:Bifunctional lysylphosphatidylglycerol flippase/synthetase MprF n=1 Tax=Microbacterium alkaliflavum TaxID=3248839 RepID=A0ABW7Q803_9MICO